MQLSLFKAATDANETFEQPRPEDIRCAPIEIIIAGANTFDKSLISAIIEKALQDVGYTGVVMVDSDESPTMREQMAIKANMFKLLKSFRGDESAKSMGKPITLRQVNMDFAPPTE